MSNEKALFIGGTGLVGRNATRWFRDMHPNTPILVGSRKLDAAQGVANTLGNAEGAVVDLDTPGLGLSSDVKISAVVVAAPEAGVNALKFSLKAGIPYLSVVTGLPEAGPEVAWFSRHPNDAPVVLASHWMGGAAAYLVLEGAKKFDKVHSVKMGTLLDNEDVAGPAAYEDMERLHSSAPANIAFENGRRVWLAGDAAISQVVSIDGRSLPSSAFSSFDIVSIQAATQAPNVRFEIASDVSSSRRRGGKVAIEILIDIEGEIGGKMRHWRGTLEFDDGGQASLTGLSAALLLTRLMQLDGGPAVPPGLYMPEYLADPDWFLSELRSRGARIESALD